jgi:AcrR family transcriptional regulator
MQARCVGTNKGFPAGGLPGGRIRWMLPAMTTIDAPNTPQPGRPRDKSLDDTLLRITMALLAESGFEGVTMAKLVRLSGIPATSIYRRYPDARSLVMATIVDDLERVQFQVEDQGSLRGDLLAFLHGLAETLTPVRARMIAGMLLPLHKDPQLAEPFEARLGALRSAGWHSIMARAVERGVLRAEVLDAHPLGDVAQTMIFQQIVVNLLPADEPFLLRLLDNVLMPALDRFLVD